MSICSDEIPHLDSFPMCGCREMYKPTFTVIGDTINQDGEYFGHIEAIEGGRVSLKYLNGPNPYMNGQKMVLHCSPSLLDEIKNTAL